MKIQTRYLLLLTLLVVFFASCRDHYNDAIDWMDSIEVGTSLQDVKDTQPEFIEIDWDNPDTDNNEKRYFVSKIRGSKDILNMTHYLVFIEGEYQWRNSHK